jgi:hypothetical protein
MWAMVISSSMDPIGFAEPEVAADQLVYAADHAHVESIVRQHLAELRHADRADRLQPITADITRSHRPTKANAHEIYILKHM